MGEQYIFYVTDDNLKHYSKNVSTPYEKEMASDIINALKDRIQFIKTSVQAAIYRGVRHNVRSGRLYEGYPLREVLFHIQLAASRNRSGHKGAGGILRKQA